MYAVLVKNSDESYDVLALLNHEDADIINGIDAALASGNPIVGMDASDHKLTATYGSTWDGNSFSGGKVSKAADATEEELNSFNLYVFLSNNVLVARYGVRVDSPKVQMFAAAIDSEITLVKVPEDQAVSPGETHRWDGSRFL
jgi:flagellar basal body P-ring protein FlgI